MKIDVGELNKKISIIILTIGQDAQGFPKNTEDIYCSPFAKVSNMSGTQMFKAGKLFDKSITKFVIRYRRDKTITDTMRIRYKNDFYEIIDVNNVSESNEYVEIMGQVILNG